MTGPHTLLTVRGRYSNGSVTLETSVPLDGPRDVLVTFLDEEELVLVPAPAYEEIVRELACQDVQLTRRERDVLGLLQGGLTNREIAVELQLSTGTIRNYTSALYEKLKVRNRLEAVARAAEMGLLG